MGRPQTHRDPERPESARRVKTPKNPKGWLPKKAAIVLLFLCLPRFICFTGAVFILVGMILTICGYSESVPYYNKVSGPCLLVFGVVFVFAYVIWKNFRRGPERDPDFDGIDNSAYGTNNNVNGRKSKPAIINIPAPEGTSAPAIQIQAPTVRSKNVHFKKTTADSNFLAVGASNAVTASPVISLRDGGATKSRTKRKLGGSDMNGSSHTVEVDLHHIPTVHTEPQPGPSGTGEKKTNGIYTIPTVIDDDDEDF